LTVIFSVVGCSFINCYCHIFLLWELWLSSFFPLSIQIGEERKDNFLDYFIWRDGCYQNIPETRFWKNSLFKDANKLKLERSVANASEEKVPQNALKLYHWSKNCTISIFFFMLCYGQDKNFFFASHNTWTVGKLHYNNENKVSDIFFQRYLGDLLFPAETILVSLLQISAHLYIYFGRAKPFIRLHKVFILFIRFFVLLDASLVFLLLLVFEFCVTRLW